MLHEAGETRAGHVQGRTRALRRFGPVFAKVFALARVHVPVLSILTIAVHGESCSVACVGDEKNVPKLRNQNRITPVFSIAVKPRKPHERPRPFAVGHGISREGLSGTSEAPANKQVGTRLCCKYICTTEWMSIARLSVTGKQEPVLSLVYLPQRTPLQQTRDRARQGIVIVIGTDP